ncbi:MAG: tRNA pseudouridine(55) synthase TruB [Acidimicrobiales bacterium]
MAGKRQSGPHGLLLVDKSVGWTSHDVVARARSLLDQRRVGHSGTLDPPATGLLLLGVGNMTRTLRFLTALPKTYVGTLVLGTATSTLDDTGDITAYFDMEGTTLEAVSSAASSFLGEISQIPPMVSAIKIDGKRLHELARAGEVVEREPRRVTIHALGIAAGTADNEFELTVRCSSGTYIRTLAEDIATALGGGGHLKNLRRTDIGSFSVRDACVLPPRDTEPEVPLVLVEPVEALRDYPSFVVDQRIEKLVGNGVVLNPEQLGDPAPGPVVVVSEEGALLAIYAEGERGWKPELVIAR